MTKTIQEWYEDLPEPIRSQAIANAAKEGKEANEAESLAQAIAMGFVWSDTPERYPYWEEVCTRACNQEFNKERA